MLHYEDLVHAIQFAQSEFVHRERGGVVASFELAYDEDEDVLEATFAAFDEHFARTIVLNDNIVLYTDTAFSAAWGLTFYSYGQLLQVSETHLDGLNALDEPEAYRLLGVIGRAPVSLFLQILDSAGLRALVKAPGLESLLQS